MKNRLFAFAAFSAVFAATAHDARGQVAPQVSSAAAPSPLAGMYELVRIDGHAIPYAAQDPHSPANAPAPPEVIASTLMIKPDGAFLMAMGYRSIREDSQRFSVRPFSGTTAPDGDAFIARWDGAGQTRITRAGDTLIVNNVGLLFAYRKLR